MNYNIVNEVKVTYTRKGNSQKQIRDSHDSYKVFKSHFDEDTIDYRESVYVLYLDQKNTVLGIKKISECGISSAIVDVRMIFQGGLLTNCSGMILCHNHPSGNLKPSMEDIKLTKKVKEGGELLNINLLDHLIITSDSFFSFLDEGIM